MQNVEMVTTFGFAIPTAVVYEVVMALLGYLHYLPAQRWREGLSLGSHRRALILVVVDPRSLAQHLQALEDLVSVVY